MHSLFLPTGRLNQNGRGNVSIAPTKRHIEPLARSDWPAWTILVELARQEGDKGLGDTVVHLIGDTRSERFKAWFQEKFGKSCGCTERQAWLNARYPYLQ